MSTAAAAAEPKRQFLVGVPRPVGDAATSDFCDNAIRTTKYTAWPFTLDFFLWKMLYEQFQRKANVYFLIIGSVQMIPGISPTGQFTTIATLVGVLLFSFAKSGYEDLMRRRKDVEVNSRTGLVIKSKTDRQWREVNYTDVEVGDIVLVRNEEDAVGRRQNDLPCDIVILSTSDPEGLGYVETANLDGETNVKVRQCLEETCISPGNGSVTNLAPQCAAKYCGATFESEQPNGGLYTFTGNLTLPVDATDQQPKRALSGEVVSFLAEDSRALSTPPVGAGGKLLIGPDQTMYRGCLVRKVHWVVGLAVFTGAQTKIMMNAKKPPHKSSRVERLVNKLLLSVLCLQVVMVTICAVGLYLNTSSKIFYLAQTGTSQNRTVDTLLGLLTFFILFNNLIPISLYVSLEMIKFAQGKLMEQDLAMYYAPRDMPMSAKTTDLNEELGQIDYVFSDKTGTLTCNVMSFLKFVVRGNVYGQGTTEIGRAAAQRKGLQLIDDRPLEVINSNEPFFDPRVQHQRWYLTDDAQIIRRMFTLLAVCHTVVIDGHKYEAESPDEEALVKAARMFGFTFVGRNSDATIVEMQNGEHARYQLLEVIAFNSDRKRMSVVVRDPQEHRYHIFCKGADNVMFKLLSASADQDEIKTTMDALATFGDEGLRTLVLADRVLERDFALDWVRRCKAARGLIGQDAERLRLLEEYAAEVEKDLNLIGATAIEDKLQLGVPHTIEALRRAGLKVWVLTGDKPETAINIGFACSLVYNDMNLLHLIGMADAGMAQRSIEEYLKQQRSGTDTRQIAVVVDGMTLKHIFEDVSITDSFYELTRDCQSVICCRVSPAQKAEVVDMVRARATDATTLAIGDGANDVPMIQAAHVGVGISGMEGQQAANSADYAIGQFRFLHRLTLVHGRANYQRLCSVISYFFYKNAILVLTQFWYCLFNRFTGQSLYEQWTLALYNVFFTFLPIVVLGIFDRDIVNTDNVHAFPALYHDGTQCRLLNVRVFLQWLFNAVLHSAIIFFSITFGWGSGIGTLGRPHAIDGVGITIYTSVLVVVTGKVVLHSNSFSWMQFLGIGGSLLAWFIFLAIYSSVPSTISSTMYGVLTNVGFQLSPWIFFFLSIALCLYRDGFWRIFQYQYLPIAVVAHHKLVQLKDSVDPVADTRLPIELRDGDKHRDYTAKDVVGGDRDIAKLFKEYNMGDDHNAHAVFNPSQDIFMQFVEKELEDEFLDNHIGDLARYKVGMLLCAIASSVLVANFARLYAEGTVDELEIGGWATLAIVCWITSILFACASRGIKPHLHIVMITVLIIGFSGMSISNLAGARRNADTHPVTLGVILLGLLTVVRPPLIHAIHYILIAFVAYVAWYQAFRVKAWQTRDFAVRFVELVIVAVTSLITLVVTESFLRRMFISQKQVEATSHLAEAEEQRSLGLLANVLPAAVVNEVRINKRPMSDFSVTFSAASLLQSDIVKFTVFSCTKEPHIVVEMLNRMFTKFDAHATALGLEKIKTVGDAYVAASGIPIPDKMHETKIILMGLAMIRAIGELNKEGLSTLTVLNIAIRVGAASGEVRAGVFAKEKVGYDVFGDTAEEAELMEQTGQANRVQVTEALMNGTKHHFSFDAITNGDGVTQYFVVPQADSDLRELTAAVNKKEEGAADLIINGLNREDIYAFLEDDNHQRRTIIRHYGAFHGELSNLSLNFDERVPEKDFRYYYRFLADNRILVETGQITFYFFICFVLFILYYPYKQPTKFPLPAVVTVALGALHLVHVCYRAYRRYHESKMAEVTERDGSTMPASSINADDHLTAVGSRADVFDDDLKTMTSIEGADEEGDPSPQHHHRIQPVCTCIRFAAAFSGLLALLVPILVIVYHTDSTISVFVAMASNVIVVNYMHIRFLHKVAISLLHFLAISAAFFYTVAFQRGFRISEDGGDFMALVLCYLLNLAAGYMTELSVRRSFSVAKKVVYQNCEVVSAVTLCEKLLNNVLPRTIVQRMKDNPTQAIVDEVPEASVLFLYSDGLKPHAGDETARNKLCVDIVNDVNGFLWVMDSLCVRNKCEKIKTVPYLVVSGCPDPTPVHASRLARCALDFLVAAESWNRENGTHIRIKAGIHTGKVTAGVLGSSKFQYDIFGDTVNFASRLTTNAEWGTLQVSQITQALLATEYEFVDRGQVELKGKGAQHVFVVTDEIARDSVKSSRIDPPRRRHRSVDPLTGRQRLELVDM